MMFWKHKRATQAAIRQLGATLDHVGVNAAELCFSHTYGGALNVPATAENVLLRLVEERDAWREMVADQHDYDVMAQRASTAEREAADLRERYRLVNREADAIADLLVEFGHADPRVGVRHDGWYDLKTAVRGALTSADAADLRARLEIAERNAAHYQRVALLYPPRPEPAAEAPFGHVRSAKPAAPGVYSPTQGKAPFAVVEGEALSLRAIRSVIEPGGYFNASQAYDRFRQLGGEEKNWLLVDVVRHCTGSEWGDMAPGQGLGEYGIFYRGGEGSDYYRWQLVDA